MRRSKGHETREANRPITVGDFVEYEKWGKVRRGRVAQVIRKRADGGPTTVRLEGVGHPVRVSRIKEPPPLENARTDSGSVEAPTASPQQGISDGLSRPIPKRKGRLQCSASVRSGRRCNVTTGNLDRSLTRGWALRGDQLLCIVHAGGFDSCGRVQCAGFKKSGVPCRMTTGNVERSLKHGWQAGPDGLYCPSHTPRKKPPTR